MDSNTAETSSLQDDLIDHALISALREALHLGDFAKTCQVLEGLHAADVATLLSRIPMIELRLCIQSLGDRLDSEVLTYLDDELRAEVIELLGVERVAEALVELEIDDAVAVIEELGEQEQVEILQAVEDDEARADLEAGLSYPEDSAGRLMQKRLVSVPEFWNVGQVIDYLLESEDLPQDFYEIIVINPRFHPVGTVMISRIMQNHRECAIRDLMKETIHTINVTMDQEEVARLFHRYGLAEAPVVSDTGRIAGVVTIDDIVDVIKEEEEEDFMRSGGVFGRDLHAGLWQTMRQRLPWLLVNLATATLAAWVISQYEDTIEKMVVLAVLMPVVASMAGNGGIQSVTIAVRGVATRELQRHNAGQVIVKEMLSNFLNGLILSLIAALIIGVVYQNMELALVFGCAMTLTLAIGGLVGTMVPLILDRLKVDPAIASGVFLTTTTDMISFFSFLGLASWWLL